MGDTEAALRSLVVKGEIDKEMNKEDKALTRKALNLHSLALAEKGLAGDTFYRRNYFKKNNKVAWRKICQYR